MGQVAEKEWVRVPSPVGLRVALTVACTEGVTLRLRLKLAAGVKAKGEMMKTALQEQTSRFGAQLGGQNRPEYVCSGSKSAK